MKVKVKVKVKVNVKDFVTLSLIAFFMSSCASGQFHSKRSSRGHSDQISEKKSSYRVRGKDKTGVLSAREQAKLRENVGEWRWPVNDVQITSHFGERSGNHHDGIDLRAGIGTPVYAASNGSVIYSGSRISGYGKMIVLKHEKKLSSVYAHNSKIYVKKGQKVRRGQLIALSGNTGRSSGPHVHFEIRQGVTAINPSSLMVSPAVAREANRRIATSTRSSEKIRSKKRRNSRYEQYETRRVSQSSRVTRSVN
jgi:murein DD-endopeptidase MepM/ murein hydrolase activator NlpD